jgi:hypothetical protein
MKPACSAFFVSQKRQPLTCAPPWLVIRKYGDLAGLELLTHPHPHQLRHACGFALADQGADTRLIQDYLGHRDIRHTVIYRRQIRPGLKACGDEEQERGRCSCWGASSRHTMTDYLWCPKREIRMGRELCKKCKVRTCGNHPRPIPQKPVQLRIDWKRGKWD